MTSQLKYQPLIIQRPAIASCTSTKKLFILVLLGGFLVTYLSYLTSFPWTERIWDLRRSSKLLQRYKPPADYFYENQDIAYDDEADTQINTGENSQQETIRDDSSNVDTWAKNMDENLDEMINHVQGVGGPTSEEMFTNFEMTDLTIKSVEIACRIPQFNINNTEESVNSSPTLDCEHEHPAIFTTDLTSNLVQLIPNISSLGYTSCCYNEFWFDGLDSTVDAERYCTEITEKVTPMPAKVDFIMVYCMKSENVNGTVKNIKIPIDAFGFVNIKPALEARISNNAEALKSKQIKKISKLAEQSDEFMDETTRRKVNVVVFGMDSVSRISFLGSMPLVHEYLTNNLSAIGLTGFSQIEAAPFPAHVLSGNSLEEYTHTCWKQNSSTFDDCPFIWQNYSASGYRTSFGEDVIDMQDINHTKLEFLKSPTDYYLYPLTTLLAKKFHESEPEHQACLGPRLGFDISLVYLRKMAFTMNKARRYFQFVWTRMLTDGAGASAKHGELPLLNTLTWFQDQGFLEDTILILMSDHGSAMTKTTNTNATNDKTSEIQIEDRMPFLYFILPEWFKMEYQLAVNNLIANQNRLTTAFDLHETLQDLLTLSSIDDFELIKREAKLENGDLPRGISLFLAMPPQRTCEDAGIKDEKCVCESVTPSNSKEM